jgi:hypothetical protein
MLEVPNTGVRPTRQAPWRRTWGPRPHASQRANSMSQPRRSRFVDECRRVSSRGIFLPQHSQSIQGCGGVRPPLWCNGSGRLGQEREVTRKPQPRWLGVSFLFCTGSAYTLFPACLSAFHLLFREYGEDKNGTRQLHCRSHASSGTCCAIAMCRGMHLYKYRDNVQP